MQGLFGRCKQALAALHHTEGQVSPYAVVWPLLPASFLQRFDLLIGHGCLPVASIRQLDLQLVQPGNDTDTGIGLRALSCDPPRLLSQIK